MNGKKNYEESELVELKSILNEEVKTEIVAFLNSYLGGKIYIGVTNEGEVGTQNVPQNVTQNVHQKTDLEKIIYLIKNNSNVTLSDMADFIGKIVKTVQRIIKKTTNIKYVGSSKLGHWEIIEGENK